MCSVRVSACLVAAPIGTELNGARKSSVRCPTTPEGPRAPVKQHIFSVLSVLFLLAACGNDSATNPGGGGQGNTGGTTSTDCQVCGPSTDDFFDNATVANLRLTFDAA